MKWHLVPLHRLLQVNTATITLLEHLFYKQAVLQPYPQGVVLKEEKSGLNFPKKRQQLIHAGQFVISRVNLTQNLWGMVPPELDNATVLQSYLSFDLHPDLYPAYFAVYLAAPRFRKAVLEACSKHHRLEIREFLKITLPLPPINHQRQIASVWRSAHKVMEHTTEMAASLDVLKSGVMWESFQRGSASWQKKPLGRCALISTDPSDNYAVSLLPPDQLTASSILVNKGGIGIKPGIEVDGSFLYFYLQYQQQALFNTFKGAKSGMETDLLRAFPLLLPTLYEQKKIAALLQQHDWARLHLQQEQSALQNLIDGLMDCIFTDTLNLQEIMPLLQHLRSMPLLA